MISISYAFRVGHAIVSNIIKETCLAIWDVLRKIYLPHPTDEKLKSVAEEFENQTDKPHCVGAIDGKHIAIQVVY